MRNQFTPLNRPSNHRSQLASSQQQGNLSQRVSLGFGYPHPFSHQPPSDSEDRFTRQVSGTNFSALDPNLLSAGAFGDHWDFLRSASDSQHVEESRSSPENMVFSWPEGSSPAPLSDVTSASQLVSRCDSEPHSSPASFDNRFTSWMSNVDHEYSADCVTQTDQLSSFTVLTSNQTPIPGASNQNQVERPHPSGDSQGGYLFDDSIQPWEIKKITASSSNGIPPGASSANQLPEERKNKRWKRKVTDRRREQNRVHQRAFRQRREIMLKQKDVAISNLKERLIRYQEAVGKQSEIIKILQARLGRLG